MFSIFKIDSSFLKQLVLKKFKINYSIVKDINNIHIEII